MLPGLLVDVAHATDEEAATHNEKEESDHDSENYNPHVVDEHGVVLPFILGQTFLEHDALPNMLGDLLTEVYHCDKYAVYEAFGTGVAFSRRYYALDHPHEHEVSYEDS